MIRRAPFTKLGGEEDTPTAKSHQEDGAHRNRHLVLNLIRERGPLSRRELSVGCNLSVATSKRLVDDLLTDGLVREGSLVARTGIPGRRSVQLQLNGRQGYSIGFSVDRQSVGVTVLDLAGQTLHQAAVPVADFRPEEVVGSIVRTAHLLRSDFDSRRRGRFLGIGVGVSGLVDAASGLVHYCPSLPGWENVGLKKQLVEQLDAQVFVDEEVRCMALAEKRYGWGRDRSSCLFVYIGLGVGAGVVLDGRIYRGRNGMSGGFGHITIKEDGPICNCGNRGCLEALVSTSAIIGSVQSRIASNVYTSIRVRTDTGDPVSLEDIAGAAADGDKLANMVLHETAEYIGAGLVAVASLFDPGEVVLAGEVFECFGEPLVQEVAKTVGLRCIHALAQRTALVRSELPPSASLGAALLPLEDFFESDLLNLN